MDVSIWAVAVDDLGMSVVRNVELSGVDLRERPQRIVPTGVANVGATAVSFEIVPGCDVAKEVPSVAIRVDEFPLGIGTACCAGEHIAVVTREIRGIAYVDELQDGTVLQWIGVLRVGS